jgi:hypothetical protein
VCGGGGSWEGGERGEHVTFKRNFFYLAQEPREARNSPTRKALRRGAHIELTPGFTLGGSGRRRLSALPPISSAIDVVVVGEAVACLRIHHDHDHDLSSSDASPRPRASDRRPAAASGTVKPA